MKFCANISTMFSNLPIVECYSAAANLGFKAVESQYIPDIEENEPEILARAMKGAKVAHVLLNSYPGEDGQAGFASSPREEDEFRNSISNVLKYTFSLGVKKLHILSGVVPDEVADDYVEHIYVQRFRSISEVLEEHQIVGLIEPLSPIVQENYFVSSFPKAIQLLEKINCDNIKLLLDVFHLQQLEGTVENLEKYFKYAGHVQVSQSPNRSQLDADGDINYEDVLKRLENLKYDDYVGLEYFPTNSVEQSLTFINKYGYTF